MSSWQMTHNHKYHQRGKKHHAYTVCSAYSAYTANTVYNVYTVCTVTELWSKRAIMPTHTVSAV